ncbi:hypothetical protein JCM33374_g1514 [Metschnikowia sp. JCM 33374]|nr:hypothetical protein JCM33374_g1514 [Metschnikowia sp. JCM 33374]
MYQNFLPILLSSLLLSSNVYAQVIRAPINEESDATSQKVYDPGFQKIIDQLEVNKPIATEGIPLVIVYEKAQDCPAEVTITHTKYVDASDPVDVSDTRVPEPCKDNKCTTTVQNNCVTQTYEVAVPVTITSTANSGHENITPDHESSQPGSEALEIIKKLGPASTRTILTDGATTSVDYVSTYTGLSTTKENPIFKLTKLEGAKTISINSDWTFTTSSSSTVPTNNISTKEEEEDEKTSTSHSSKIIVTTSTNEAPSSFSGNVLPQSSFHWNQTIPSSMVNSSTMASSSPVSDLPSTKIPESSSTISGQIQSSSSMVSSVTGFPGSSISESLSSSSSASETSEGSSETIVLTPEKSCINKKDLFERISNSDPGQFYPKKAHPLQIPSGVSEDLPFQTNKFYSNLFLGNQGQTVFTYPYEVYWENGQRHGLAVQYPNPSRKTFGGDGVNGAKRFYFNGVRDPGLFIGATTIDEGQNFMTVSQMKQLSVSVNIAPEAGSSADYIEFPLVEGMGVVTSIYHGSLVAKIQGNGGIAQMFEENYDGASTKTIKYRVQVGNGETWLILVTLPALEEKFELKQEGDSLIGSHAIDGLIIQVALAPEDDTLDKVYYGIAGQYVTDAKVLGSIACDTVNYKIAYETKGTSMSGTCLTFALPHHIDILEDSIKAQFSGIKLPSTTKGMMYGYLTNELSFADVIDNNVQWLPYVRGKSAQLTYTKDQIEMIREASVAELKGVDVVGQLMSIGSQYFMGKALDKYAYMMYVLHDIVKDEELAAELLTELKAFFEKYRAGETNPALFYDTKLKGVTSQAAFTNPNDDFGSGFYNDHNFHYSYTIHAAALIGYVDAKNGGDWAMENKELINNLVRDVANPSEEDEYFPVSRSFDWFQGHSWAKGVFESADGKDQESSSEDVHFSYAMKLWGRVIGDDAMQARGDLMLSIQNRAFNSYFLYKDDNDIVPKEIVNNKVSGIFFENKVDYGTFFGSNPEFIHGIQMIPMTAALGSGGWAGILNANRVLFDPSASWEYFAQPDFDFHKNLDGGQSLAWALAFTAPFKNEVDGV